VTFDFEELLGRGAGLAAALLSDRPDEVRAQAGSARVAGWRLWARGDALRRADEPRRALRWLREAADAVAAPDLRPSDVWRAEHAASVGHVQLLLGEPGTALSWLDEALARCRRLQELLSSDPATADEPLVVQV
jgi:hypothetical protein